MLDARNALFLCAFILLTVPFIIIAHKAASLISQIEQEVAQVQEIE